VAGLVAGVVVLSLIGTVLLGAVVILAVYLFADLRRLPVQLSQFLHKQTSIEMTYEEICVRISTANCYCLDQGSQICGPRAACLRPLV